MGSFSSNRREFLAVAAGGTAWAAFSPSLSGPAAGGSLQAGAAASNITPPLSLPINGIIVQGGPTRYIHDELFARCLVLDNGIERVAMAVCDCRMISRDVCEHAKQLVTAESGFPSDRILIAATHSHSVPTPIKIVTGDPGWPPSEPQKLEEYKQFLARRIADGIRRAIHQIEPAEIGWGSGMLADQVFNRRWFVRPESIPPNPFGRRTDQVLMNPPAGSDDLIRPAGPADPELAILALRSLGGRPIALLANYGLHYVGGIPAGEVSADYFGVFAREVTRLLGAEHLEPSFVAIMSNGTSGDVNNIDFSKKRSTHPPYARIREVGARAAAEAVRVYRELRFQRELPIGMSHVSLPLGVRRPTPADLKWARSVVAEIEGSRPLTRPQIYAREALMMAATLGPVHDTLLQAIRLGDLGIAAMPSEVFAETGLEIKSRSPMGRTFTIELANDYTGYLPTPRQHELGGYETWPARSSFLEVEAAPKMVAALLAMFGQFSRPSG